MNGGAQAASHEPGAADAWSQAAAAAADTAERSEGKLPHVLMPMSRISWRRRALLLAAVVGCLAIFLLARALAIAPHINAEWRTNSYGRLVLDNTPIPLLHRFEGSELLGVLDANGALVSFDALTLMHSSRWLANDALRNRHMEARLATARAMESGNAQLVFETDVVAVPPTKRSYAQLGLMFWLMSAFAMTLFLVGWIVPLVQPQTRNVLYAVMAQAQAMQLMLIAVESVPGLAMPTWLVLNEAWLRTLLDVATAASIVHAATLHPTPLPYGRTMAAAAWGLGAGYIVALLNGVVSHPWWWTQGLLLGGAALTIALFYWSYRRVPHPLLIVSLRFGAMVGGSLLLLTLALGATAQMTPDIQSIAAVGPVIWCVFLSSLILLVPFLARSQHVMREFALLAGVSTVATSVDLLFVAVFSLSQFASLTVSLFIALGVYAAVRQYLVSRMMGARALTTERVFDHLYRISREIEARPDRAAERMTELLRNVFEPLVAMQAPRSTTQTRVVGSGSTLLVPMPVLSEHAAPGGLLVLRFAERGKRLFTLDDVRLADRVLEQLQRAVAHDRAVERGRSEERLRIAQDLHDDIGARLLTLMYKSPTQEMEDYVRHTLQDLKTLTRGLAAASHPLSHAAGEWKADISQRLGAARCALDWHASYDHDVTLTMVQWSSLTRILRELVNNVISHAGASRVRVDLDLKDGALTLCVTDDGRGMQPEAWSQGLGLGGIRKRVKSMAGHVHWQQRSPHGIACIVHIPHLTRQD